MPLEPTAPALPSCVIIPPAAPSSVYVTVFQRKKGFVGLAQAELEALGGGGPVEDGIWLSQRRIRWAETGFGLHGGRQLACATNLDDLREQLLAHGMVAPRVGITVRRVPRRSRGAHAAKVLIADCIDADVDYEDPELRLILVLTPRGYRVLVDEDGGDPAWLASRRKPWNYLAALPVRLAKAMLNLTVRPGDTVYDPFCGSGTIPLLAAWAGHRAFGSDISGHGVERAHRNVRHFGQRVELACVDARETDQRADCIVTNPPYGVYCHLAPNSMRETLANLRRLASRVTLVTSERLEDALRAEGYRVDRVLSVEAERFERFIYLTHT